MHLTYNLIFNLYFSSRDRKHNILLSKIQKYTIENCCREKM